MADGVPKHHYTVPWVIFGVVVAISIVAFLYWKYQVPEDEGAGESAAPVAEERNPVTSPVPDVSGGASAVSNPLEDVPSVNPIEAANPFKGKINPFE